MKLWLISQNQKTGYDTYDSAVVSAKDMTSAALMNPANGGRNEWDSPDDNYCGSWCDSFHLVKVKLIGNALKGTEAGIIVASFNAG